MKIHRGVANFHSGLKWLDPDILDGPVVFVVGRQQGRGSKGGRCGNEGVRHPETVAQGKLFHIVECPLGDAL